MRNDVEQAISDFGVVTFGRKKDIENGEKLLSPDEKVLFVTPTNLTVFTVNTRKKDALPGVVFLTDKRLLFYFQTFAAFESDEISLDEINSINCSGNGLTGGHVEVHTVTKTYSMLVTYKRDIVQKIQQTFGEAVKNYKSRNAQNAEPKQDILSQIEKLSDMKAKGILSEEEFQNKKKELLSRL